jgi:hypothetical protein
LRWVAGRRGILVPSLLADRRVETEAPEPVALPHADTPLPIVEPNSVPVAEPISEVTP